MLYFLFNMKGVTATTTSEKIKEAHKVTEVNKISSFSFYIHSSDPAYNNIIEKITQITVFDDYNMDVTFRGRVYKTEDDGMSGFKYVICEDPLGYLRDTYWRGPDAKAGDHIMSLLNQWLGGDVNLFLPSYAQFNPYVLYLGTNGGGTSTNNAGLLVEDIEIQGLSHFEVLEKLTESIGWEFMVEYRTAIPHYTIYLAPYFGYKVSTPIATGLNLKSLKKSSDYSDFYNRVFPLGGYGYDEKRLTLKPPSPGDGGTIDSRPQYDYVIKGPHVEFAGNSVLNLSTGETYSSYVDNVPLVTKYGPIAKCVIFDDIVANSEEEVPAKRQLLYEAARRHARLLSDRIEEFEIDGYDIHRANYPVDELVTHNFYDVFDIITDTFLTARLWKLDYSYENPLEPSCEFKHTKVDVECETR